jgi:hypothetical protein
MSITLRYKSARKEVMNWYWRALRKKLWKAHLLIFCAVAWAFFAASSNHRIEDAACGAAVAFGISAFLMLWPMLMFKSSERTITLGEKGIETRIGDRQLSVSWADIEAVEDIDGVIALSRKSNGNAFLLPERAFGSNTERQQIIALINKWRSI